MWQQVEQLNRYIHKTHSLVLLLFYAKMVGCFLDLWNLNTLKSQLKPERSILRHTKFYIKNSCSLSIYFGKDNIFCNMTVYFYCLMVQKSNIKICGHFLHENDIYPSSCLETTFYNTFADLFCLAAIASEMYVNCSINQHYEFEKKILCNFQQQKWYILTQTI